MNKLKTILSSRYIFKIFTLIILSLDIFYLHTFHHSCKYNSNTDTFIGVLQNYEISNDKLILEVSSKEKILVSYQGDNLLINNLSLGDKILIKGNITNIQKINIPNTFSYEDYLKSKKIYHLVSSSSITKLENNHNYLYTIKNIITRRIKNLKSKDYLNTFILGHNTLASNVNKDYRLIGISHLFSISGMHISLFISILSLYFDKITYQRKIKYLSIDIFLLFYLLLINTASLLRSTIMHILFSLNYLFPIKIKKIDLLLLTLSISIIINPYILLDISFIYSYVISSFLILFTKLYRRKKKIIKVIIISSLSFIISLPLNIYTNYEVNILSILFNIILTPFISLVIFPLSLLTLIFPILDNFLFSLILYTEKISHLFSLIDSTILIFKKPSLIFVLIYYLLLIITIKHKKYIYIFALTLIIYYFSPYLNNNLNMIMFDVGEADSIFLSFPHNEANILIDTGKSEYTMLNGIIPYLKSQGISKLDYLIISHGDLDHIGGAISLINNFKVENIILNCYSLNDKEKELINISKEKNIKSSSCIDSIKMNNYQLLFLNTKEYATENDNSSVIYLNYHKYKFLFMGDAEISKEKDLIKKYNLHDIDILKVGHHGSATSSSKEFISTINPKYSLISLGRNNIYHHPNESVLNILSNSCIFRTDISGSIEIKVNKKGYHIETYN